MATVFIGIGSNLGDRRLNLEQSVGSIALKAGSVIMQSGIYETEPWGFSSDSSFLNMVIKVETGLEPEELLFQLLDIEKEMGRVRTGKGYRSRVIDLDILLYDDLVINSGELVIPHPLLHKRMFVLEPLCEIAPDFVHPVLNKTIAELKTLPF